jgi:outer membrane biosynthesis protein TonB
MGIKKVDFKALPIVNGSDDIIIDDIPEFDNLSLDPNYEDDSAVDAESEKSGPEEKPKPTTKKTKAKKSEPKKKNKIIEEETESEQSAEIEIKIKTPIQKLTFSESELEAIKMAVGKCQNLFKNKKYNNESNPVKSHKKNWIKIMEKLKSF